MTVHPIPPVFDKRSQILILGSFPSVKSREVKFFYGHPQNRFWRVVSAVFNEEVPASTKEKRELLLRNHIAVWDCIGSCEITGSSDISIRYAAPNDISIILDNAPIKMIFTNGKKSHEMYIKHIEPITKREDICLPSTSPANAQWNLERLIEKWKIIKI